jgi:hypothetical protein
MRLIEPQGGHLTMQHDWKVLRVTLLAGVVVALTSTASHAQKKYDTGATDTEIKIGNIMPYSGPASSYATIGKTEAAYFKMINEKGGINGRKITFISYDDGYSPPKTVEQARKLVENDEVLFIMNPLGTPGNTAIQKYMNTKKVPQLFVSTGAAKWADPKNFPWTMGWQPSYQAEARIYAQYIMKNHPGKKVGVLYANDDFGKDYIIGLGSATRSKITSSLRCLTRRRHRRWIHRSCRSRQPIRMSSSTSPRQNSLHRRSRRSARWAGSPFTSSPMSRHLSAA